MTCRSSDVRELCKSPLTPNLSTRETLLDRGSVEALLPHRGPALLVDRVCSIDRDTGVAVAAYDVAGSRAILAGHFPGNPIWPGVLQLEAIGQLGILALRYCHEVEAGEAETPLLTELLGARFLRPVTEPATVTLCARFVQNGLFFRIAGQCIVSDEICSAAILQGL